MGHKLWGTRFFILAYKYNITFGSIQRIWMGWIQDTDAHTQWRAQKHSTKKRNRSLQPSASQAGREENSVHAYYDY